MKIIAKQNRELTLINAQNTQNENDAEKIILQVPEKYEDFNKKIVFITPDGNVWDIITNNEYLIKKAITKYNQVDFYIWLTKEDVDFRSQTKTLKFYNNTDASDEITDEEIGGVNTIVNLLEAEITKVDNIDIDAIKVENIATITITDKEGNQKVIHISDGENGTDGQDGRDGFSPTIRTIETTDGYDIEITDINGTRTITITNGKDGKNGLNGQDGKDGVDGKDGTNGVDGQDGQDGYTPIRGTDYWTASDISAIESHCDNYIDANITQVLGGSY